MATQPCCRCPPEASITLKRPEDFKIIGVEGIRRLDSPAKVDGSARFAIDIDLAGMLVAVVAHPPLFGATVRSFDATAAMVVPDVQRVVPFSIDGAIIPGPTHLADHLPTGVAVLAKSFWAAQRGRDALFVEWGDTNAEKRGTPEIAAEYRSLLEKPGMVARRDGDVARERHQGWRISPHVPAPADGGARRSE